MKLTVELSKNPGDALWGAYAQVGERGYDGTGETPEIAIISLLTFSEIQEALKKEF